MEINHNINNLANIPVFNTHNTHPSPDALSITGVMKKSGRITGYQLSNGQTISKEQGVEMAKQNKIHGVGVATNQGTEYLRALPDGNQQNNLNNLPTIVSDTSRGY